MQIAFFFQERNLYFSLAMIDYNIKMDKSDEKNKFCYEKFPYIQVLPIYRVHRVHEEQDGPVTGYAICYDMKVITKH